MSIYNPDISKSERPFKLDSIIDVEIFDPPMCCSSGLCGPTQDQTLLDIHEMTLWLQDNGYKVNRYQMASSPQAFTSNSEVMRLVREKQMAALPIVMVRGKIISVGSYPKPHVILQEVKGTK
jgi:hypothetical protein